MRLPVAPKIAFISAGAITGTAGSPTPPSGASYDSDGMKWTTICLQTLAVDRGLSLVKGSLRM